MRNLVFVAVVVIGCVAVWRLGGQLSADAIGMAVGILLGVMAGIPAALLVLAGSRREERAAPRWQEQPPERQTHAYPPPVIVLNGPGAYPQPQQLTAPPQAAPYPVNGWPQSGVVRQFKIVGEQENWLE